MCAAQQSSMHELMRRRRGGGFFGRRGELAAFRANLDTAPEDDAHRFVFHVHGPGGVGKSSLLRQWQNTAREHGALLGCLDEGARDIPDTMAALSAQLAEQGRPFKSFDKLLATYRERRHEAETAPGLLDGPTAGSVVAAQVGLAGLGLLPGFGPFVGAVDPGRVAQGADRVRAVLSARFRSEQDVRLVMEPLAVLTPVLVADLAAAAATARWATLFFDDYERTGPSLDRWLRDLVLEGRYGALPANLVVTLAGQGALAPAVWSDHLDLVEDVALDLFTEDEARQLLTARGVTDESVVETVLRLSGRLPVLVSTLAATRPAAPDAVDDRSETAVERFLKWVDDPASRSAALAAALPRRLDEDVFRAAVAPGATDRYDWLRTLPFVDERLGQAVYHDVVRTAMLRLQRSRSPQGWREQHERLAAAFLAWRADAAAGLAEDEWWDEDRWTGCLLEETYHLLCANPRQALGVALSRAVDATTAGLDAVRRWARMLAAAGADRDAEPVREWGLALSAVLTEDEGALTRALTALLAAPQLPDAARAIAYGNRSAQHHRAGEWALTLADCDDALRLGLDTLAVHERRGWALGGLRRWEEAIAELGTVIDRDPASVPARTMRAVCRLQTEHFEEAVADLDVVLTAAPDSPEATAARALVHLQLGHRDEGAVDLSRYLELATEPSEFRARVAFLLASEHRVQERFAEALDAYALALEAGPEDLAGVRHARALTYVQMERYDDALADLDLAVAARPGDGDLYVFRAYVMRLLARYDEALADLDRAEGITPDDAGVINERVLVQAARRHWEAAVADCVRLRALQQENSSAHSLCYVAHLQLGRPLDALADLDGWLAAVPQAHRVQVLRAGLHSLLGRDEQAWADLDAVAAAEPDAIDLRATRVALDRRAGRFTQARTDLARAIALAADELTVVSEGLLLAAHDDGLPADRAAWEAFGARYAAETPQDLFGTGAFAAVRALLRCVLADWPAADDAVDELAAGDPSWAVLAALERDLEYLAGCPGADEPALDARRARLTAVRRAREAAGEAAVEAPVEAPVEATGERGEG